MKPPVRAALAIMFIVLVSAACTPRATRETPEAIMVRDNDAAALAEYLAQGGNPDATGRNGDPLLYLATGPRGGMAVLTTLIEAGAQLDKANADGRTALMNAAGWCDAAMVSVLLEAGADKTLQSGDGKVARDAVCSGPLDRRAEVLNILDASR